MRIRYALLVVAIFWSGSIGLAQGPIGLLGADSKNNTVAIDTADALPTASPEQVRELLQLLADEKIVRWLQTELDSKTAGSTTASNETLRTIAARRLQKLRERAGQVMNAMVELPALPDKLEGRWQSGMTAGDTLRSIIYLLIFLFIGFGLEWLYWCYASLKLRQLELSNVAGLSASAKRAATVGILRLGGASLFSLGCIGTFLFFEWSELASQVVFGVLIVAVTLRVLLVVSRVIFAPASEHLRMVPLSTPLAKRSVRWIFIVVGVGLIARDCRYLGLVCEWSARSS